MLQRFRRPLPVRQHRVPRLLLAPAMPRGPDVSMTYDPPRRIKGWSIEATCPACGDVLEHVAVGKPDGATARAIGQCSACRRQFVVEVKIADITRDVGGRPAHPKDCSCDPCRRGRARAQRERVA